MKSTSLKELWCASPWRSVSDYDRRISWGYLPKLLAIIRSLALIGHYPHGITRCTLEAPVFSHETLNCTLHRSSSPRSRHPTYVEILRTLLALQIPLILHLAGSFTPTAEKLAFARRYPDCNKVHYLPDGFHHSRFPHCLGGCNLLWSKYFRWKQPI